MRTILLSLLLSVATLTTFTTVSRAQTSGDEAAIKQVIYASRLAFNKRDLKAFSALFIKSPSLYYQVRAGDNQLIMARGWEAMTHMVGGHMKNDPQDFSANPIPLPSTDTHIQVRGNIAWVEETGHWENSKKEKGRGRDLVILEKQGTQWKIAALTSQVFADKQLVVIK